MLVITVISVALKFIEYAGGYVAAPSANVSGRPSPTKAKYVIEDMNGKVDMVKEDRLTNERLQAILVDFKNRNYKYLDGYELEDIHYKFNRDKIINVFDNQYLKETRQHKYSRLISMFKDAYYKDNSIAKIILDNFLVKEPEHDHHIQWAARLYMVTKVLVCQRFQRPWGIIHMA